MSSIQQTPTVQFTSEQAELLRIGDHLVNTFVEQVDQAISPLSNFIGGKRHSYFVGRTGIGKTHTLQERARHLGIDLIEIHGPTSMNDFLARIALAVYSTSGTIVVWMDEPHPIFHDVPCLAAMKGALDENLNVLEWSKNINGLIRLHENESSDGQRVGQALRTFQNASGVSIPTDRIRFVITTYNKLTEKTEPLNSARKTHEASIRDQVNYVSLDFRGFDLWGFLFSQVTSSPNFDLSEDQRLIIFDWLFQNWDRLSEHSMRVVQNLAAYMKDYPKRYKDHWNDRLDRKSI